MSNITNIEVCRKGKRWVMRGERREAVLDAATLAMEARAGGTTWRLLPAQADDLTVEAGGARHPLSLTAAAARAIDPYHTGYASGVKIELSDFSREGQFFDLRLQLFIGLEGPDEELVCAVAPVEGAAKLKELQWPRAFAPETVDATVLPNMQGVLLPRDWPDEVKLDELNHGRTLYMPWWGHQQGDAAAMTILETPDDAGLRVDHPAGGPTRAQVRWVHSLGQWRYPRRARLVFFDRGNYVAMAKRYRRHAIETGLFVSLREKIAREPRVGRLIGSPVIHTGILTHIEPASQYYDAAKPENNHKLTRFAERTRQVRALAARGVTRAYLHLDGWGARGYDNLHPDLLPPAPEAGGWKGLRALADACAEGGILLALHDNYRDYFHDAASFDARHAIRDERGERPTISIWYGGAESFLCAHLAPGFVTRNYRALLDRGIRIEGAYLDTFAVVPPDECYHPEHPMTRGECLHYRADCFRRVRALLGVVSSEEPADWAVPYLDLVHHGPFACRPGGAATGIPIPLFNLVYHDAILLPWSISTAPGGDAIPAGDAAWLHAMLNAGLPYLRLEPDDAELKRARTLGKLHQRVGLLEMVNHEFLDATRRRQRTTFADGTTVTVDFATGAVTVEQGIRRRGDKPGSER